MANMNLGMEAGICLEVEWEFFLFKGIFIDS